jgi:hypothetical protein
METSILPSKEIEITSVRFRQDTDQVRFESYPRRLVYKGREYSLVDAQ